jgi:hypothetical protein
MSANNVRQAAQIIGGFGHAGKPVAAVTPAATG